MKTLITYKSKYGTSKKYALWISEELKCDVKNLDEVSKGDLDGYDVIIHGGGLYAGVLSGLSFYKKNMEYLKENNKKLIAFATGAAYYGKKVIYEVQCHNFKGIMKDVPFFYFEGNYDYSIMTPVNKLMMKMMHKMLSNKIKKEENPDPMDKEFQSLIFSHFERADKKWIKPLIDYVAPLS